jgi:hypothetical protein
LEKSVRSMVRVTLLDVEAASGLWALTCVQEVSVGAAQSAVIRANRDR